MTKTYSLRLLSILSLKVSRVGYGEVIGKGNRDKCERDCNDLSEETFLETNPCLSCALGFDDSPDSDQDKHGSGGG